jgi:hypothetical protein
MRRWATRLSLWRWPLPRPGIARFVIGKTADVVPSV